MSNTSNALHALVISKQPIFLRATACMLYICYSAYMLSPVRLSVRPSDGWINFHHTVAQSL